MRACPPVRRSTSRSPAATATGAARRRIAATAPSGRSSASRPLRPTAASTAAVPRWSRARARSGERRREPDEQPVARDDRRVVGQLEPAVEVGGVDPGEVERGPARVGARDGRAVDLDLADADGPVARHEPEGRAARQRAAAQRAGDDDPAALDREDPVDREARAATEAIALVRDDPVAQLDQRRAQRIDPGPVHGRHREDRRPGERRPVQQPPGRRDDLRRSGPRPATSAFVTTATPCRISSASSSARCSIVCARGPSSAATTSIAASISPAPTSMLPTSRSCPGTSTKSSSVPSGSARWAYPTSMVIPRRRSSGSRSASIPVSARSSVVLPWSMWPAVPTTTVIRGSAPGPGLAPRPLARASVVAPARDRPEVEHDARHARRGRRPAGSPARRRAASADRRPAPAITSPTDGERLAGQRPAADRPTPSR